MADQLRCSGVEVSAKSLGQIEVYISQLLKWNTKYNLTAIVDVDDVLEKHIVDSLAVLKHLKTSSKVLDVGSGAGFPGFPLAICDPSLNIISVESIRKKVNFQKHVIRLLQLKNIQAIESRFEELNEKEVRPDFIVARALSSLDSLIKMTGAYLHAGAALVAMKGGDYLAEAEAAAESLSKNNLKITSIEEHNLPISQAKRAIVIVESTTMNEC